MRVLRTAAAGIAAGVALLALCTPASADTAAPAASASPSTDADATAAPTEAGTSFRTATAVRPDQEATAQASTGDYLYWQFPADAGDRATVTAKVTFPATASPGQATSTWQVDVYDGLRRRQACRYGRQTADAAAGAGSVTLSCHLRTVRAWAEPWSNDPLPGAYYVRLTAVKLNNAALGVPVKVGVTATTTQAGGSAAVDGRLARPVVQGSSQTVEPDGGWSSGWWSDRWLWTAGGALLASLAGIGGYVLTRGRGRPASLPPQY
ncbi:hypothetical protein ACFV3R_27220 [Streptomyces sp. NPDC059740]|uniref:hypothetical protein n=1 Tax=Streptomyces sp. NPDC059740 TaxID=3346926 RepID=UPI003649E06F